MSSQFQSLMNEFNILISKYQDTYQKYITVTNSDSNRLKILDNFSFFGKNQIATLNNTDSSNCQSACLTNSSCSGATFNTLTNNCIISSGSGNITPTQKSKAIIKESIYYSYELHNLNNKLIDINKKIMNNYNDNYQKYTTNNSHSQKQENIMNNNYQILKEERNQIEEMINEFESLHRAYEDGNINVSSNYYTYIILLIVVIFLLILLLNFSFTSNQSGGSNMLRKMNIYNLFPYFFILILVIFFNSGYNL